MIVNFVRNLSIARKIYLAGLVLPLFTTLVIFAFVHYRTSIIRAEVIESNDFTYPMANLTQIMTLHSVQVQQWLTDVSATGDASGYEDAETHAQEFNKALANYSELSEKSGLDHKQELKDIRDKFSSYYEKGKLMAKTYVEKGQEAGNVIMEDFDQESQNISSALETLTTKQTEQFKSAIQEINNNISQLRNYITLVCLVALGISFLCCRAIKNVITAPIYQLNTTLKTIEQGDLTARTAYKSNDEMGQICANLNATVASMQKTLNTIGTTTKNLSIASVEMTNLVHDITASITESSAQSEGVSSAAEEINKSIEAVATASEELAASTSDSASNTQKAAFVAKEAVSYADQTSKTIIRLNESSAEIDKVVSLITSIAEQTNLLALNATIEAARAGEAGKGFAVVANEVKELAKQTAHATNEIGNKISGIRQDTKNAVIAVENFNGIIANINETLQAIASAVEEQNVTTNEISKNMSEASTGVGDIAHNISGIAEATNQVSARTTNILNMANQLSAVANDLSTLVSKFHT